MRWIHFYLGVTNSAWRWNIANLTACINLGALCWPYIMTSYSRIMAPNHLMILSCFWNSKSRKGLLKLSFDHKTFNQLQSASNSEASLELLLSFFPILSTQDRNLPPLDSRPLRGLASRTCCLVCTAPWCSRQSAHPRLMLSCSADRSAAGTPAVMDSSWASSRWMEVPPDCTGKSSAVGNQC